MPGLNSIHLQTWEEQMEINSSTLNAGTQYRPANSNEPAKGGYAAAVIDGDNLANRGRDRFGKPRIRNLIDIRRISVALWHAGVRSGSVFWNKTLQPAERHMWERHGFAVASVHANVDPQAQAALRYYATRRHIDRLVLVAGDEDYANTLADIRARGIGIEVWARQSSCSDRLRKLADRVAYIDEFLTLAKAA
jgi:hypothetical protein